MIKRRNGIHENLQFMLGNSRIGIEKLELQLNGSGYKVTKWDTLRVLGKTKLNNVKKIPS